MWLENEAMKQDMENISAAQYIPWEQLSNKTILITGATGLIGSTLVNGLLYANRKKHLNLTVLALVRDEFRAKEKFSAQIDNATDLQFVLGTVENLPEIECKIDYIIHGASQTASKAFVEQPVETIVTAISGTHNLLELAKKKSVQGFVYLSSMEVYGHPERGHKVTERDIGCMTPLDVRNSYPISKQQCESLCCAYASEYKLPVMIARLTQTFGPGVHYNDNRVFAYFGRCVKEKQDIVLKTKGETERSYLYTADAATAILTVLLKGESSAAYNMANEATYCSIAEMAQMIAKKNGIGVRFEIQSETENGYPATIYMDLDTSKLKALGWLPVPLGGGVPLIEMYERMIGI